MGADLYIDSVYTANRAKFATAFNELVEARDGLLSRPNANGVQYPGFYTEHGREQLAGKLMVALVAVKNGTPEQNKLATNIEKILRKLNAVKVKKYIDDRKTRPLTAAKLKPIHRAIQKQVEYAYDCMFNTRYFRESYGGGGILNRLGLSWWEDFGNLVNKKTGFMAPTKAKKFIKILQERKPELPTAEWATKSQVMVDDKNTLEEWDKYHARRKKELINFLQTAIDLKEPIRASI